MEFKGGRDQGASKGTDGWLLAVDGDTREGDDGLTTDGGSEDASGFEDAEKKLVSDLGAEDGILGAGHDLEVVDLTLAVYVGLNDNCRVEAIEDRMAHAGGVEVVR